MLREEAISVWRRLFLRAPQAQWVAEGHFAVALLEECSGEIIEAINEYRLIARRYRKSHVTPRALLRNARLLMQLGDFTGAKAELTCLLDRYPRCEASAEAYAALGKATMEAGHVARAAQIFRKLYFLNLSPSSRRVACFHAAKCFYRQRDYQEAMKWIDRYIAAASRSKDEGLAEAYLLRGRACAAAGMATQAVSAFAAAVAKGLEPVHQVDAYLALAETFWKMGKVAKAAGALSMAGEGKTQEQKYQVLRLAAKIYRGMGLPEKAAKCLRVGLSAISDPDKRARLGVELSRCYREAGQLAASYEALTAALPSLPVGGRANEAAFELAEVCLELGKARQAIALAKGVLGLTTDDAQRRRAERILTAGYLATSRYDTAAAALARVKKPIRLGGRKK